MNWLALLILMTSLLLGACAPAGTGTPATQAPAALASPAGLNATAAARAPGPTGAATPLVLPIVLGTPQDLLSVLADISDAPPDEAQARADALWQTIASSGRTESLLAG